MSPLHPALNDYLTIRRALGYKLARAEKLLGQYLDYLDEHGERLVTVENAVAWATLPAEGNPNWWAYRLTCVRGFAKYLHALDPTTRSRPPSCAAQAVARDTLPLLQRGDPGVDRGGRFAAFPVTTATYRTLIGLLSVTGMRVGEAIRLDNNDVDLKHGVLTVRETKFGKTRELPLHASTVDALARLPAVAGSHMP